MSSEALDQLRQSSPVSQGLQHRDLDDLLDRVGRGDREAFATLYDQLAPTVYAMMRCVAADPQRAARLTQDVFLRTWSQASRYDPTSGSAWTWVHLIALASGRGRTAAPYSDGSDGSDSAAEHR